jgi:hypothetical protein
MVQALNEANRLDAAAEVMAGLRSSLRADLRAEFRDMNLFGQREASRQMGFYGVQAEAQPYALSGQIDSALEAVISKVDGQSLTIKAMILTGADKAQIVGDESRTGALRPSDVVAAATFWAASLAWTGFDYWSSQQSDGVKFKKQALAALDNRTTDCCLRVHGQIQPMDKPFILTGSPRYADEMDWPAFHSYCRTSGVLYLEEYDLGITERLLSGAETILSERASGVFKTRKPADAFG